MSEKISPLALKYEELAMANLKDADVKKLKRLLRQVSENLEAASVKVDAKAPAAPKREPRKTRESHRSL